MKAVKVKTNFEISIIVINDPTLEGMQKEVAGYIEHVRPFGLYTLNVPNKNNLCMIVNEDGYSLDLDVNQVASALFNISSFFWSDILGDVLFLAEGIVNDEIDFVGLDDEQAQALLKELKRKFKFLKEVPNEIKMESNI